MKIKIKKLNISVATGDAAKTAIMYGIVSQSVAYLLQFFDTVAKVKRARNCELNTISDFLSTKTKFEIDIVLSWRLWHILCIAITTIYHSLTAIMAHLNRGKQNNINQRKKAITEEK